MPDQNANTGTGNEISSAGKFWAGTLLITLTAAAIIMVMAFWPNKMPSVEKGDDGSWYTNQWFNVTLITPCVDSCSCDTLSHAQKNFDIKITTAADTLAALKARQPITDTAAIKKWEDQLITLQHERNLIRPCDETVKHKGLIHLNTILLILVALMGFLGNMIHIATSFTTFIGNGMFKKSWMLWYFVKPFTAAALAIIIYFVVRAGFLSYGTGASGVSLYGILSLAALAGLFTDSATLKLKEVFDVIFKPKDDRKDKLTDSNAFAVTAFDPPSIPAGETTTVTLKGKNLNPGGMVIKIDNNVVTDAVITADTITLKCQPSEAALAAAKITLLVTDKNGGQLYKTDIPVTSNNFLVTSLRPETIPAQGESLISITGSQLNGEEYTIYFDNTAITPQTITPGKIEVKYQPTATAVAAGKVLFEIKDKNGTALFTKEILITN